MTVFWIIVAAMTLAAVASVAPALLRARQGGALDQAGQNVAIARERLAELEADRAAGDLSEETFEQARAELENTLADDIEARSVEQKTAVPGGRWAFAVVLVLVPVLALGLYWQIGAPQLVGVSGPGAQAPAGVHGQGAGAPGEMPPVEDLVDMLAAKLEKDPDNPDGWYLLGRTYMSMQRFQEAAKAFERLHGLVGDDATVLLAWADASAMSQGARVSGHPAELAKKALELEPDNATALWLSAKAAAESGEYLDAIGYWRKVEAQVQDDPQILAEVRGLIAQAQRDGNISDEQMPPAPAAPEAAPAVGITVNVSLDEAVAAEVSPEDTVFVFARAAEGSTMPLAAARRQVKDLPLTITLTDEMSMVPQAKLSSFSQVQVSARVSKSGDAIQKSGDLVSDAADVEVTDSGQVSLTISNVVP